MRPIKYRTSNDVATNFTDIKVRLQKRDYLKVALFVFAVEVLLRAPVSKKTEQRIREAGDRLVDRIDAAVKETKWGDASTSTED